ncbi:hypothetical protein Plec18167_004765 [Paecilomyces lecythidis]|uniref:S-adenosyl-L-methionine-dependent methyltransferase n=1 Tax=Paecilomyces lecythidis TaxID=3004212 RepID=A0ABR3XPZ4_9EURO
MADQAFSTGTVTSLFHSTPLSTDLAQDERIRLDLQHQIWLLTLHGNLHPTQLLEREGARRASSNILDVGCGTGAWGLSMARTHPAAHIVMTDITPPTLDPASMPGNVSLVESNADHGPWPFPHGAFDLIHVRMLTSGIHDWPSFLARCHAHLAPLGYLELLDVCHPFRSFNACYDNPEASAFIRFGYTAERSWKAAGLDYRATTKHVERLQALGFRKVTEKEERWPLGPWGETERERKMGELTLRNFLNFIRMAGLAILTQGNPHNGEDDSSHTRWAEEKQLIKATLEDLEQNWRTRQYYLCM